MGNGSRDSTRTCSIACAEISAAIHVPVTHWPPESPLPSTEPVNIVGVVGAVVVLSLLVILTVTGLILYYNPLLCLRGRSSPLHRPGRGLLLLLSLTSPSPF